MSKIIEKILKDKTLTTGSRVSLIREWLKTEYRVKDVKDVKFLERLTEVHDHDNLALHFGEVKIGSAFSSGVVRIFEVNDGWHLGYSKQGGGDFAIIHPGYEKAGLEAENLKTLNIVKSLLKTGSVVSPAEVVAPVVNYSTTGSVLSVVGLEETVEPEDNLVESPVSSGSLLGSPTTSVSINLDDYLK